MTDPHLARALDDCLAQLDRTAVWLRRLPLARFAHDNGAVERQARDLVTQVAVCVQEICRTGRDQAERTGGHANLAGALLRADCPPADAVPDQLSVHALGDQLAVHAGDLARCGRACISAGLETPMADVDAIAAAAIRLRSGS